MDKTTEEESADVHAGSEEKCKLTCVCKYGQLNAFVNRNFRGQLGFVDGNAINLLALSHFMKYTQYGL